MDAALDSRSEKRPRREALVVVATTFLLSRVALVIVALTVEFTLPLSNIRPTFSAIPVLSSLTGSDSLFLLGIAADGYHATPIHEGYLDWAFFPLYPIAVRLASFLTFGNLAVAGILVANVALLAATGLLYRLGEIRLGHRRALLAVVYLIIAPGAVGFAMAYSDSLFLLLALCAFAAAERGRLGLMGLAYALATLTRLPGILLGIPLLLIVLRQQGRSWRAALPLILGPISLGAFTLYLWQRFGVWFAYLQAQVAWNDPTKTVGGGGLPAGVEPLVALLIGTLLVHVFLLVYVRVDRFQAPEIAYLAISLLTILSTLRLLSVGRYLAVVWPFDWLLAGRSSWVSVLWPFASGAMFTLYAFLHFSQALAP